MVCEMWGVGANLPFVGCVGDMSPVSPVYAMPLFEDLCNPLQQYISWRNKQYVQRNKFSMNI